MRKFNSFVMQKILEDPLKTYSLVFLDFETGPVYFTTLPYDVTFNGNTYVKDVGIVDYSVPIQSNVVDRQTFSLVLSDNNSVFKNSLVKTPASRAARIYLGFFNSDGTPNTDPANVIITHSGFIDGSSYSNDFQEAIFTVELSSPMADLSLVKTLNTSGKGMDEINTSDTSFDKVIEDNEEVIKWGKI